MGKAMSAYDTYNGTRYFGSLDGIRAASILAVIWHHTAPFSNSLPITSRGFLGVDMFFVLSGWLIVMLLLRENDRNGDISLRKFYMRRTLRIFPIYYALLLVLALLFYVVAPGNSLAQGYRDHFLNYITYTANWVHDMTFMSITWSLATEEQFYLVWPPIQKFLKGAAIPLMLLFVGFNQLINFGVIFQEAHARLEILQSTFTPICIGVLLAHALHRKDWFERIHAVLKPTWMPVLVGVLLLVMINLPTAGSDISGLPRLLMQLLMLTFLASVVVREEHWLYGLFNLGIVRRIGVISYGMYLYHMVVRHVGFVITDRLGFESPSFPLLLITLVGTFIVAELSFRFFETPILKFKDRWSTHKTPQTA